MHWYIQIISLYAQFKKIRSVLHDCKTFWWCCIISIPFNSFSFFTGLILSGRMIRYNTNNNWVFFWVARNDCLCYDHLDYALTIADFFPTPKVKAYVVRLVSATYSCTFQALFSNLSMTSALISISAQCQTAARLRQLENPWLMHVVSFFQPKRVYIMH